MANKSDWDGYDIAQPAGYNAHALPTDTATLCEIFGNPAIAGIARQFILAAQDCGGHFVALDWRTLDAQVEGPGASKSIAIALDCHRLEGGVDLASIEVMHNLHDVVRRMVGRGLLARLDPEPYRLPRHVVAAVGDIFASTQRMLELIAEHDTTAVPPQ